MIVNPTNQVENLPITFEDIKELKRTLNLSENKTLKAARVIRKGKRKILEGNLKSKLTHSSHVLDDYFECVNLDFTSETNGKVETISKDVIICKDLEKFIDYVICTRNVTEPHLKFGTDGGGKFLKICLSFQSSKIVENEARVSRKEQAENFKNSGVKKLFMLAIVQSTQENYNNIKILWDRLNINQFLSAERNGTITMDLKLANIICGLMNHASTHPCTWCVSKKNNFELDAELRTITRRLNNFKQ